jgi:hypothetical protein
MLELNTFTTIFNITVLITITPSQYMVFPTATPELSNAPIHAMVNTETMGFPPRLPTHG